MIHLALADMQVSGALVVALGFLIGVLAGFYGVGGGFLLTPLLNALLGIPYPIAIGSSLSQMVGLSSAATMRHGRLGHIDYRLGLILLVGAGMGAEAGAQALEHLKALGQTVVIGHRVDTLTLLMSLLYIVLLSAIGWYVAREACRAAGPCAAPGGEPSTRAMAALRSVRLGPMVRLPVSGIDGISLWVLLFAGLVTGFLSGLLGVGGGVIMMPMLIYVIGCPTVVAIGTGLFQTVFIAGYGAFSHALKGNVDLVLVVLMLLGSTLGAGVGAGLTTYADAGRMRGGFAILTLVGVVVVAAKLVATVMGGPTW